ncbi:hypothetical protein WR25_21842 [Diploscapter pachys]|uniref:PHD-type domain-containing protein n=1 Tax=Diploscapter pachys TaxID=2018661 RepID=A0A2A2LQQ0_9BILA|nr:hypothetical protein WR25_21842 [Diploscapter pachys]
MSNVTDGIDDGPPVIPRYDAQPVYGQTQKPAIRHISQPIRTLTVPANKVLILKRPDGSTAYLRAVTPGEERSQTARAASAMGPKIRTTAGASVVGTTPTGTRILRIASSTARTGASPQLAAGQGQASVASIGGGGAVTARTVFPVTQTVSKTTPISTAAYQTITYQSQTRAQPGAVVQPRRIGASYPYSTNTFRFQTKSARFDFENNDDEDRAISEAIAKEEEKMNQDEEENFGLQEGGYVPNRDASHEADSYPKNLILRDTDSPNQVEIKVMLNDVIKQVAVKLDPDQAQEVQQQHQVVVRPQERQLQTQGQTWVRPGMVGQTFVRAQAVKRPITQVNPVVNRYMVKKVVVSPNEVNISAHIERLKKEINKRRTALENIAEEQVGLLAPWRKAKGRPNFRKSNTNRFQSDLRDFKEIKDPKESSVDPAEISLTADGGGDIEHEEVVKTEDWDYQEAQSSSRDYGGGCKNEAKRRGRPPKGKRSEEPEEGEQQRQQQTQVKEEIDDIDEGPDPGKKHCVCNKPYDSTKFYISCDSCRQWFHGRCVNLSEKKARRLKGWLCSGCQKEGSRHKEESNIYCICRTPYDEHKFYVCCDTCEQWYHPECVGISIQEAEQRPTYTCPPCEDDILQRSADHNRIVFRNQEEEMEHDTRADSPLHPAQHYLSRADYQALWRVVERIFEDDLAAPLKTNVPKDIDLNLLVTKMNDMKYHTLIEFTTDVRGLFERAKCKANKKISDSALALSLVFEKELATEMPPVRHGDHLHNPGAEHRQRGLSISLGGAGGLTDQSLDIDTDQLIGMHMDVDPHEVLRF